MLYLYCSTISCTRTTRIDFGHFQSIYSAHRYRSKGIEHFQSDTHRTESEKEKRQRNNCIVINTLEKCWKRRKLIVFDCCFCCSDTVTKNTVQMGLYLFMIFEIFRDSFRIYEWIPTFFRIQLLRSIFSFSKTFFSLFWQLTIDWSTDGGFHLQHRSEVSDLQSKRQICKCWTKMLSMTAKDGGWTWSLGDIHIIFHRFN